MRMGSRLEDIISEYDLCVHNDGTPTYRSVTATNVTITKGCFILRRCFLVYYRWWL